MQVNVVNLMTTTTVLIETSRDAVFRAVVSAAITRVAAAQKWNSDSTEKAPTLVQVDAEMREQFFATNKKSNAYRWISMSIDTSKKLARKMIPTLDAAKTSATVDDALSLVIAALRVVGADNLDNLEIWSAGEKAGSAGAAKDHGQTLATLLEKHGEELDESAIDAAIKALGDLKAHMIMLRDQEAARSQAAANLRLEFVRQQKKAAVSTKRKATLAAKRAA